MKSQTQKITMTQLAKYQQMFDTVKDDIAVKEMVKMIFIEKQIEIAKAKKKKQNTNLWDILPYDCQESILSHKQKIEWGYLGKEFGKYPMTTITRWMSANHVRARVMAGNNIPFLWSLINRKNLQYAVAHYKTRSQWSYVVGEGVRLEEKLIADGVENIGYQHEVYKDISLDSLKEFRSEELAKQKEKRDAKRKEEEKKQKPTLAVGTLIAKRLGHYSDERTFLIIRGETKTQYRVEKVCNQTVNVERWNHPYSSGGIRYTTRCPKVGQTYVKHKNISKNMSEYELEYAQDYKDKGDYYEIVAERVWHD